MHITMPKVSLFVWPALPLVTNQPPLISSVLGFTPLDEPSVRCHGCISLFHPLRSLSEQVTCPGAFVCSQVCPCFGIVHPAGAAVNRPT